MCLFHTYPGERILLSNDGICSILLVCLLDPWWYIFAVDKVDAEILDPSTFFVKHLAIVLATSTPKVCNNNRGVKLCVYNRCGRGGAEV